MGALPEPIQTMLLEMEVDRRERLIAACKADPVKHKATLQFDGPLRYRYYNAGVRRGRSYRFGWTTTRNAAGYYLSFREVYQLKRKQGFRDQIVASKTRSICKAKALARFKKHRGE